jgi:hypothetical protein
MIVFDLRCAGGHVFEAWFGSSGAYEEQRASAMIACPICGLADVTKAVMAPNVAAKGNRAAAPSPGPVPKPAETPPPEAIKAALVALAEAQAKMLKGSQFVGLAFADRARAMHHGEEDHAPIHGHATADEAIELIEDGVGIAPLVFPVVPPGARN